MSRTSDFSIKPSRGLSREQTKPPRSRFMAFIRSLFQPVSESPDLMYKFSLSLKRHPTTVIRSNSQYEYLSDSRNRLRLQNTPKYLSNMTLSGTNFVQPIPSSALYLEPPLPLAPRPHRSTPRRLNEPILHGYALGQSNHKTCKL